MNAAMRQKVPWNLEGIDPEAREAAKEAARRAGMTLGEWLNATIADRAARFGVEQRPAQRGQESRVPESRSPESPVAETLDQVANRLSRLTRGKAPAATLTPGAGMGSGMGSGMGQAMNAPMGHGMGQSMGSGDVYGGDIEAIVAAAAAESERRMRDSSTRTAHALDSVARWMERADERFNDVSRSTNERQERTNTVFSQAFGLMTKRLDDIERKLSDGQQPALKPVWTAMERMEKQLGRIAASNGGGEHLERLEGSLSAFEERLAEISERLSSMPVRRPMRRTDMGDAVAEIRARQSEIEGGLPEGSAAAGMRRGVQDDILRGLKGDMAKLASKLDTMRRPVTNESMAEYLRDEVSGLHEAVRGLASRDTVDALEAAIRDLGQRLLDGRLGGLDSAAMEPIEKLHADVRRLADRLGGGEGDLTREVRHIAHSLDALGSGGLDPATLSQIAADVGTLREALDGGAQGGRLQVLTGQIGELSRHMAQLGERQIDALDFAALKSSVEEIRAGMKMRGGRGRAAAKDAETGEAEAAPDFMTAFSMQIEALSQKVDGLSTGVDQTFAHDIGQRLDALAARLDERPVASTPDPEMGELLRTLVARMDEVQKPQAATGSLDALEKQVAELAARLDAPRGDETIVGAVERAMADLSAQIETLRTETLESGERAARQAVDEALQNLPAVAAPEALTRDLGAIRAAQDAAETRTQSTLEAVHDTLDKVVDRLARLEGDMRGDGNAPAMRGDAQIPVHRGDAQTPVQGGDTQFPLERGDGPSPFAPQGDQPADAGTAFRPAAAAAAASPIPAAAPFVPSRHGGTPPVATPGISAEDELELTPADFADAIQRGASGRSPVIGEEDMPLEPGAGRPQAFQRGQIPTADEGIPEGDAKARFIAAARRAAQAAQSETKQQTVRQGLAERLMPGRSSARSATTPAQGADAAPGASGPRFGRLRQTIEANRRPILLGLAAIVLTIGVAQIGMNMLGSEPTPQRPAGAPPAAAAPGPQSRVAPSVMPASRAIPDPATTASLPARPAALAALPGVPAPAKIDEKVTAPAIVSAPVAAPLTNAPPMAAPTAAAAEPAPAPAPKLRIAGIDRLGPIPAAAGPAALRQAALAGDPAAVYEIASRLSEGRSAPRDPKLALKLFERAAAEGYAPAQYRLGSMLEKGAGVPRDLAAARQWYDRAAAQGNSKAMHNLAVLLAEAGADGKPDYAGAADWFRKAAEHGVRDSQYNLAILLARGLGAAQDLTGSYVWFAVAAAKGDEDAGRKRDEVGARLAPADRARAMTQAERFRPLAADPQVNEVSLPEGGFEALRETPAGTSPLPPRRPRSAALPVGN